ncbi:unnamed protein product, partial [Bubo scandiacus]
RSIHLSDWTIIFCFTLLSCVPRGGWFHGSHGRHQASFLSVPALLPADKGPPSPFGAPPAPSPPCQHLP